jgi:anti-sigma regulatory factor (Ser/Thr protein kinase)
VEEIGHSGTLLGVYSDPTLTDLQAELLPGDALVLFTDGLSERRAPLEDRSRQIRELLAARAGAGADDLLSSLERLALGDGTDAEDDVAVLILRRRDRNGAAPQPEPAAVRVAIDLAPSIEAPAEARQALDPLRDELDADTFADLRLLVSELVTNSVRHGQLRAEHRIHVRVAVGEVLRVEVGDAGVGFDPAAAQPREDLVGGWGLYLTGRLAERWGVDRRGSETWVWLEKRLGETGPSDGGLAA